MKKYHSRPHLINLKGNCVYEWWWTGLNWNMLFVIFSLCLYEGLVSWVRWDMELALLIQQVGHLCMSVRLIAVTAVNLHPSLMPKTFMPAILPSGNTDLFINKHMGAIVDFYTFVTERHFKSRFWIELLNKCWLVSYIKCVDFYSRANWQTWPPTEIRMPVKFNTFFLPCSYWNCNETEDVYFHIGLYRL